MLMRRAQGEACSKLVYQRLSRVRILDMCVRNISWIHPHYARTPKHTHPIIHTHTHTRSPLAVHLFVCSCRRGRVFPLIYSCSRCYFLCVCIFNSFLISRFSFFASHFLFCLTFSKMFHLFRLSPQYTVYSIQYAYSNWYKNLTSCGRLFHFVLFCSVSGLFYFVLLALIRYLCFCVLPKVSRILSLRFQLNLP